MDLSSGSRYLLNLPSWGVSVSLSLKDNKVQEKRRALRSTGAVIPQPKLKGISHALWISHYHEPNSSPPGYHQIQRSCPHEVESLRSPSSEPTKLRPFRESNPGPLVFMLPNFLSQHVVPECVSRMEGIC